MKYRKGETLYSCDCWRDGEFHIGIIGIIGGAFGGALTALIAKKHLKIANGDVLGTSNELGRLFSLIGMLMVISVSFHALI